MLNDITKAIYESILRNSINYIDRGCDLTNLSDEDLDTLVDQLFCYWFDVRKTLDEQTRCNGKIFPNYFLYEAYEAEAKSKYLYLQYLQNERKARKEQEVK